MTINSVIEHFKKNPQPLILEGVIQNYDWGQKGKNAFIPKLLGMKPVKNRAYAELWFGAHPKNPSNAILKTDDGKKMIVKLNHLIQNAPAEILGKRTAQCRRRELPFLLKALTAAGPLSIQAHPDSAQSVRGFRNEERSNIPINSPMRVYKDPNEKKELIIALTDFYLLCGFKSEGEILQLFREFPELREILPGRPARKELPKKVFNAVMNLEQEIDDENGNGGNR